MEFKKVNRWLSVVMINIAAAKEHIGKVKRKMRVIRERC